MLGENIWWGRYTGDSVEALNIGAAMVAPTSEATKVEILVLAGCSVE